jgi:protein phosphatase
VDDQHLGGMVKCGKCAQAFTVRMAPPPRVAATAAPQTIKMSIKPATEEEISLVLDGPAAAMLDPNLAKPPMARPLVFCRLDIGSASTPGRVRKRNEDSFLVQQLSWCNLDLRRELALVIVADGLGGHEAGDQASGMAIRLIAAGLAPLLGGALSGQITNAPHSMLAETIDRSIKEANRAVHRRGQTEAGCRGMGATAAVVLVWDGQVKIGHIGDCRVYHYRADKLTQVTRDQTLVERMVELGQLSPKEALTHPARSEVTQAIGNLADIAPAAYQLQLAPGDWLIVACDGLHAHVDGRTLQETIRKSNPSAALLANQLIDMANQGGGTDNCTVSAIRCY